MQPRSLNQRRYVEAIEQNDMVFSVGPAGTGKTYLAVAMAVAAFNAKRMGRIVLVRPAVEAGERLGFLPGTLQEKVDPYLRPLYDALYDLLDPDRVDKMLEKNIIEVAPLAFMRGRTLNDAFIIMDEAQNTTVEQMKMFLTRMGNNSKAVITGDITQIDLPNPRKSGLLDAINVLNGVEGIALLPLRRRRRSAPSAGTARGARVRERKAPAAGASAHDGRRDSGGRPGERRARRRAGEADGEAAVGATSRVSSKSAAEPRVAAPRTMILLDPELEPDSALASARARDSPLRPRS